MALSNSSMSNYPSQVNDGSGPLALQIQGLHKTYESGAVALAGVDLRVGAGDFFALLGPNGAGKSTLIGIISSLVNKSEGEVTVFGYDLVRQSEAVKSCLGIVPQEFNANNWEKVLDVVVNQAGYYGIDRGVALERARTYLEKLGLWEKRDSRTRELSGGMKRRLLIARALMHEPKLLILDEPTAGVDIELRRTMWSFLQDINRSGTTIILTTHYLEEAESLCENIAIIDNGAIVEDTNMKALLNKLHMETFVLDLGASIDAMPEIENYAMRKLDDTTLEVDITKDQGINGLFERLTARGIEVLSMRNKANRLEELFVKMIQDTKEDSGAA